MAVERASVGRFRRKLLPAFQDPADEPPPTAPTTRIGAYAFVTIGSGELKRRRRQGVRLALALLAQKSSRVAFALDGIPYAVTVVLAKWQRHSPTSNPKFLLSSSKRRRRTGTLLR
jgi:hypothetical protein